MVARRPSPFCRPARERLRDREGQSERRGSASLVVDHFLNPVIYLTENPERSAIQGYDFPQTYAPGAERHETLRRKSDDPYIFFRNLYLQGVQRDAEY
jgi:phospholipid-binding lipoprotein MlaA